MPTESSTAGQARRSRRPSAGAPPDEPQSAPAEPVDRRDEPAETSASSPRLDAPAPGSPGKRPSPGKAAARGNGRTCARAGASAPQHQQPPTNGEHPAKPQTKRPSKRQTGGHGVWSPAAQAMKQQVASAQLVSWPGAGVLLLAVAVGAWLPSQGEGDCVQNLRRARSAMLAAADSTAQCGCLNCYWCL